ncbi:MAG: hypothetical protein NVS4B7_16280 [Ktedonobacteraceae bacterium]
MSDISFDLIAQELLRQKHSMEQMEQENYELRHQLSDLRAGSGIFIEISDRRFSLVSEFSDPLQVTSSEITISTEDPESQQESMGATEQRAALENTEKFFMMVPETPRPPMNFLVDDEGEETQLEDQMTQTTQTTQTTSTTFLEEAMIDEFTSAGTGPSVVVPVLHQEQETKSENATEEEMAALRHQLIGSYLLE